jgi:hypothetical protein
MSVLPWSQRKEPALRAHILGSLEKLTTSLEGILHGLSGRKLPGQVQIDTGSMPPHKVQNLHMSQLHEMLALAAAEPVLTIPATTLAVTHYENLLQSLDKLWQTATQIRGLMRTLAKPGTTLEQAMQQGDLLGKHGRHVLKHIQMIEDPIVLTIKHVARLLGDGGRKASLKAPLSRHAHHEAGERPDDLEAAVPNSLYDMYTAAEEYWDSANEAVRYVLRDLRSGPGGVHVPGTEGAKLWDPDGDEVVKATAIIGILGQMHRLCQDTSDLSWAAARIADHEQPDRGWLPGQSQHTNDDGDLYDVRMQT